MRYSILIVAIVVTSCSKPAPYSPAQLSANQQAALKKTMVRYYARLAEEANQETKFESRFDDYYTRKANEATLMFYHPGKDSYFMMVSQLAPSMMGKRHATGIRFKLNDAGELTAYEEVFRTWKMLPDTLQKRGFVLFDKMVKGESLEKYETKNSNGVEYIEFPDDRNHYDTEARRWQFTPATDGENL
ncbi:MAG: hypothetical protein KF775_14850 [Cyclobacteriaceae bacterium]|nr:hypothetical protein [Cyclobacteriaceae bacterium]